MENINYENLDVKSTKMNPYGLTMITEKSESVNMVEDQITKFDWFLNEDALTYFLNTCRIDKLQQEMMDRFDLKDKVFQITFGDKDSEYYTFATMFNRLNSDKVYAKKVYRQVKLLSQYAAFIQNQNNNLFDDVNINKR